MMRFDQRKVGAMRNTSWIGQRAALAALVGSLVMGLSWAASAQKVSTEEAAGYLVFPKIVVDTSGDLNGVPMDTVIRITNTSSSPTTVHCFYVDGTPRCTVGRGVDGFGACNSNEDCASGGICTLSSCDAQNFDLNLTANQPVGWRASEGVVTTGFCVGGTSPGLPCSANSDCSGIGASCQTQDIGRVPPLAPGVFLGELKCVQVVGTGDDPNTPVNRNDLVGNASIYRVNSALVDVQTYNAIGVQAVASDGSPQSDTTLLLGGQNREYAGCSAQVVVDHFFDNANLSATRQVTSDITLVPCSERLESDPNAPVHTLQFVVFNEFEQRMSASTRFRCFRETQLSRLDRRAGQEAFSVFNVAVQGTLAGQTVIRPVLSGDGNPGNGILAVVEEFHRNPNNNAVRSASFNVHLRGDKSQADTVAY
ncbi:MAG: hypothetical protein KatS3mg077_1784 [Candidatus Binatia bacterium]|nr:MAG: hypothetical protein KatS3mg077_1784 [Candidatus Binatia bacterium]